MRWAAGGSAGQVGGKSERQGGAKQLIPRLPTVVRQGAGEQQTTGAHRGTDRRESAHNARKQKNKNTNQQPEQTRFKTVGSKSKRPSRGRKRRGWGWLGSTRGDEETEAEGG